MHSVHPAPVQKLWNPHYIFVLSINTLNAFSFYMVAIILSKYLVGIGASISLAGFVVGLFSLTSMVFRPMCGMMSDRLNKLFLLKASNLLLAVSMVGFAVTENMTLIILFRILNGVGFAIGGTAQVALATEYIPENRMGEGIGYLGLGMVLGSAVAPAAGMMIADWLGMKFTFISSAFLSLAAFALVFTFRQVKTEKVQARQRIRFSDLIAPAALPYTAVGSVISFTNGAIASYLLLFADQMGITGISLYFTIYAAGLFIIRPVAGKLTDRLGIRTTVLPALVLITISMFMLGFSGALWMVLLSGLIRAIGQGTAQPALQAGCIQKVGKANSGVATSTYYLGGDIGQGIGPMIGGFLLNSIVGLQGYVTLFSLCGVLAAAALVYFAIYTRKRQTESVSG